MSELTPIQKEIQRIRKDLESELNIKEYDSEFNRAEFYRVAIKLAIEDLERLKDN